MKFSQEEMDVAIKEAVTGLKSKNTELLTKLRVSKDKNKEFDNVDLPALLKNSEELAALKAASLEKDGEYKTLYKDLKITSEKELGALKRALEASEQEKTDLQKMGIVNKALSHAKVDPVMLELASQHIGGQSTLTKEGVFVGDKPIKEYLKDWLVTETGKRFLLVQHEGGGAGGSDNSGIPEEDYYDRSSKNFNRTKQAHLARTSPELHAKLSKKHRGK